MSLGLTNAPTTFMDLINQVFKTLLDKFIIVFIDNVLICSKSPKEYEHLKVDLQTLRVHKLFEKFSKCEF